MVGLLSKPWLGYLSLKHQTVGLMELQRLVYKYHAHDKDNDPLWTYWLLLAYEGEVLEAVEKARNSSSPSPQSGDTNDETTKSGENSLCPDQAEKLAFLGISAALRKRDSGAIHNTPLKVGLHLFGLAFVSILMIGIAGSNTMSLMGYLDSVDVSFGAYTTLFTGFTYTCALWAQWMIYRKPVPKMMKALFSFSRGWFKSDYLDAREIELSTDDGRDYILKFKQEESSALPGDQDRLRRLAFYTLCTAAVAFAWGVLVYSKISAGFSSEDGYLNQSESTANSWGLLFGVGSGVFAFMLWSTTLRSELKEEERRERARQSPEGKNRSTVGVLMILATLYGLIGSVLGQSKVVFSELGWDNGHDSPLETAHAGILAAFIVYIAVSYMGRLKFNMGAMDNLCSLASNTVSRCTPEKVANEWNEYGSRYMVGGAIVTALLTLAITSTFYDQMQNPLAGGTNGHRFVTPLGVAGIGALMLWSAFLVYDRRRHGVDKADEVEKQKVSKTALFSQSDIRRSSELRSGQQMFAALVNALAFGAIGGSGIKFGAEEAGFNEHVVTALSWLAMLALASQSFSVVNYQMKVKSDRPSPGQAAKA